MNAKGGSGKWVDYGSFLVAGIGPLLLALVAFRYASHHGVHSEISELIDRGEKIARTGHDSSAFYPPLIPYIVALFIAIGLPHGPVAIASPAILLGGVAVYWLCLSILGRRKLAIVGWAIVYLNPYLLWNLIVSKDTAYELLFITLAAAAIYKGYVNAKQGNPSLTTWIGAGFAGGLLLVTRTTGLYEILLLLIGVIFVIRGKYRLGPVVAAGILILFAGLLGIHNRQSIGTLTLATNGGVNLYFGNSPKYLNGHPLYDIDGFLDPVLAAEPASKIEGEAAKDAALRSRAVQLIKQDKAAFLYRCIAKSEWFWLNLDKVPSLSSNSVMKNGDTGEAILGTPSVVSNIAYSLYRLPTLFLLIFGTVLAFRRLIPRSLLFLYLPMCALWPICVLTFPDTRFKLAAECLLAPIIVLGLRYLVHSYRKRKVAVGATATG